MKFEVGSRKCKLETSALYEENRKKFETNKMLNSTWQTVQNYQKDEIDCFVPRNDGQSEEDGGVEFRVMVN